MADRTVRRKDSQARKVQTRKQVKSKGKQQKMHSPGIEPGARQDRLLEEMAMPNFTTKPQVLDGSWSKKCVQIVKAKRWVDQELNLGFVKRPFSPSLFASELARVRAEQGQVEKHSGLDQTDVAGLPGTSTCDDWAVW
jgi:hypothetical protein